MNSNTLKIAKMAGIGYLTYKMLPFKAVRGVVKTFLLAKGISFLKKRIAK